MKRQLELSEHQEGETASQHPQHDAATHMSASSHKALLGAVEKLLSDQREVILKRADDMIVQHVREIAKEVVAQSRRSAHTAASSPSNSNRWRQESGVSRTPSKFAAGGAGAHEALADIPEPALGAAGGDSTRESQAAHGPAGAEAGAAVLPSTPDVT